MTTLKLDVEEKFHETVNDFVTRKVMAACLVSSALLVHRSKVGLVVEGYLINDNFKYYVRHYWCRINEKDYDVGTIINMILMPDVFRKGNFSIVPIVPIVLKYNGSIVPIVLSIVPIVPR